MARRIVGVDIGGTTTKAAVVLGDGSIEGLTSIPTGGAGAADLVARLSPLIRGLQEGAEPGVGVAVAGFINAAHDRLAYNPNLAWLEGFPLKDALEQELSATVTLEIDSNAAALAEWRFGVGEGSGRFFCYAAGTGLGGGMIIGGKVLRFAYECLGDVGHVIVQPGGMRCSCGGVGCAEALIGAEGVVSRFREAGGHAEDLRRIIEDAVAGDPRAVLVIGETGRLLGLALATLANIFFPDCIAIAGGLSEAGPLLLDPAARAFRENASPFAYERARIVKAKLGWQATLVGAACGVE